MSKFKTLQSQVDLFRQRWLPAMQEVVGEEIVFPLTTAALIRVLRAFGLWVTRSKILELQRCGAIDRPPGNRWHEEHTLGLCVALSARRLWLPGAFDNLKSPFRLSREKGLDPTGETTQRQTVGYDLSLLLVMMAETDEKVSREAILELVLNRLHLTPPASLAEAEDQAAVDDAEEMSELESCSEDEPLWD